MAAFEPAPAHLRRHIPPILFRLVNHSTIIIRVGLLSLRISGAFQSYGPCGEETKSIMKMSL
jgi:hypothetical protein